MPRIGVTHAGSLIRPGELLAAAAAAGRGEPGAGDRYAAELRRAVAAAVRRQVDTGIDVIDDGEMGKSNWISYLYERTTGLEARPLTGDFSAILPDSRDRQNFPGAYAEIDALEAAAARKAAEAAGDTGGTSSPADWVVTGPMTYQREAVDRDIANFKASLADAGVTLEEAGTQAFLPVVAPASAYWLRNEYYKTDEDFVFALADVLHEEYKAIIDAGLLLQVDDAVLMHEADTMLSRGQSFHEYRKWAELRVEALNHALRGLPAERIRYHVCFGSWHGPHAYDPPIAHSIDLILKVNARYHLMEQASPRHEHEWRIWEDVPLPEGKVIVPGVVTHHTNVVEHPRLVAQRLVRLARLIGGENVMGGTDCGFAQGAFIHRVHEEIQWAKLASLAEGARIATRELWGANAD